MFFKQNFLDKASPKDPSKFPFVVVGNKCDKERAVTRETAEAWCQANGGYPYFETTATSGDGVGTVFMATGKKGLDAVAAAADDGDMPTSLAGVAPIILS